MDILVTGGSRGIGRAIAQTLAGDHNIAIGYNESAAAADDVAETVRDHGSAAHPVQADITDSRAVDRMIETVIEAFGGLDAVINSAGIVEPHLLTETDDHQWDRVLRTNLTGSFYVSRAAIPHLDPGGDIVFVSSIGGTGGTVDASYATSKAGLHGLTRALAREYGDEGVQVNAIAPGPVETDLNDEIIEYLEAIDFRGHDAIDTHLPQYACSPETVAHAVTFVLENDYIQGEIIALNGGMQFR